MDTVRYFMGRTSRKAGEEFKREQEGDEDDDNDERNHCLRFHQTKDHGGGLDGIDDHLLPQ
jgi:hypothetical protein